MSKAPQDELSRRARWALLAAALAIALGLMCLFVERVGVVNLDEPVYHFSALTDRQVLLWLWEGRQGDIIAQLEGSPFPVTNEAWAKPLWHMACVAAVLALGPTPAALTWLNVLFGLVATLFFLLLAARYLGVRPRPLLLAFGLLVLSPVFLYFCRVRLAHTLVWALFVPAVWLYLGALHEERRRWWRLAGVGLLLGAAFTTHGNSLPFILMLLGFEVFTAAARRRGWLAQARRLGVLAVAMAVPLLACHALTWGLIELSGPQLKAYRQQVPPAVAFLSPEHVAACQNNEVPWPNLHYLDQLRLNFVLSKRDYKPWALPGHSLSAAKWLSKLDSYVYQSWVYEGWVRLLLMTAGCLAVAWWLLRRLRGYWRRPRYEDDIEADLLVFLLAVPPFVLYLVSPVYGGELRNILLCWPFAALLGARWGGQVLEGLPPHAAQLAVAGLLLVSAANLVPLYSVQSGFREIACWLKERGEKEVAFLSLGNAGANSLRVEGMAVREVGCAELPALNGPAYLVASRRWSFFHPQRQTPETGLADRLQLELRPALATDFRPLPQAYDFHRRGRYDLVDRLTYWLFDRSVKRRPLAVFVYRLDEVKRLAASPEGAPSRPVEAACYEVGP